MAASWSGGVIGGIDEDAGDLLGQRLLKSLLGIILLVHFTAFCPHGGQLFRVFNGVLQQDSQLLRVVVLVEEAVHALGDQAGSAGVLRHDGRFAEDQPLGDKGRHGVIPGSAHDAAALRHQGFDLRAFQPLAVEDVFRAFLHQGGYMGKDVLVRILAHEQEGCLCPDVRRQAADGLTEDVLALAHLHGADRHKEWTPARIAQVVAWEGLLGVIRQAVDERPDLELGPHGVHGGGGVGADRADVHVVG